MIQQQIQQCQIHQLELIAIDCSPYCNKNRNLCVKCLITNKNQNVVLYCDIKNEFQQLKKEYKSKVEGIFNEDLTALIMVDNILKEYLQKLTIQVGKINSLIKGYISNINLELNQLEKKLQQIEINEYYSLKTNQFQIPTENHQNKRIIQVELEKIMEYTQIKNCLKIIKIPEPHPNQECEVNKSQINLICEKHKKPIILFDLNPGKACQDRIVCVSCISGQLGNYTEVDQVEKLWIEYQELWDHLVQDKQEKLLNKIDPLKKVLLNGKESISNKFHQITDYLEKSVFTVQSSTVRSPPKIKFCQELNREDAIQISEILSRSKPMDLLKIKINQQFKDQLHELAEYLYDELKSLDKLIIKSYSKIDESLTFIDIFRTNQGQILQNQTLKKIRTPKLPRIEELKQTYNLIQQDQINLKDCFSIAVNAKQTLLVAGCDSTIEVFEFNQGVVKHIETLESNEYIYSLFFLQKSNYLISTSGPQIDIWKIRENNLLHKFNLEQSLIDHTETVYCVVVNKSEDIMVSCSRDETIKFWTIPECECSYTLDFHSDRVVSICFNQSGNKLLSCGRDGRVLIIQQVDEEEWAVVQTIQGSGFRATFINDNFFVFQPQNGKKMKSYKYNSEEKKFKQSKDLKLKKGKQCRYLFPMIYNQENNILINKNGRIVNVIKVINNQDFKVLQKIKFKVGSGDIFGTLTNDGNYLISWDITSQKMQIRKYE